MCALYIPWICCKGCNFLSMCVINWINCMGGWMTCCHKILIEKNKVKKVAKMEKFKNFKNDLIHGQYIKPCKIGCKMKLLQFFYKNHTSLSQ
jgi:hypothetical protein